MSLLVLVPPHYVAPAPGGLPLLIMTPYVAPTTTGLPLPLLFGAPPRTQPTAFGGLLLLLPTKPESVGPPEITGTISTNWGTWTATATGFATSNPFISTNWGTWTATATGTVIHVVVGTISTNWGGWSAVIISVPQEPGTCVMTLHQRDSGWVTVLPRDSGLMTVYQRDQAELSVGV